MKIDYSKIIIKKPIMIWEHTGCEYTLWELFKKAIHS